MYATFAMGSATYGGPYEELDICGGDWIGWS